MDKNYLERVILRQKLIEENADEVSGAEYSAKPSVDEFYIWLVGIYLPTRFPTMFQLQSHKESPQMLHCIVTGKDYSLEPDVSPVVTLRTMGSLVDDDLLFLLPSEDGDGYKLKAFVTCFPNGFNTSEKLNLKLRDIHRPVPQYKEKLETSMDRYLGRLKVGKFIKRANVSKYADILRLTKSSNPASGPSRRQTDSSHLRVIICMQGKPSDKKRSMSKP